MSTRGHPKFETLPSFEEADFRTSSFTEDRAYCVQVARKDSVIAMRDSKDPGRTTLYFTEGEWDAFVRGVRNDEFDL